MPELPEVETIKRGLEKKIIGQKITSVEILNPKSFQGIEKLILNTKIKKVFRRAKVLGIEFENEYDLIFHLKMSGQVILVGDSKVKENNSDRFVGGHPTKDMLGQLPNRSTRIVFTLSDNSKLYFNDQRKFGWVKLIEKSKLQENSLIKSLGPEPLEKEFTKEILKNQLQKKKNTAVKVAILDQTVISGVGNIYACEACFLAKIEPNRKVSSLTDKDIENLFYGIIRSLEDGIKYGGSTKTHFVNADGKKGLFLDYANVYSREGQPCKVCKTILIKTKLNGRGTVFCTTCQI